MKKIDITKMQLVNYNIENYPLVKGLATGIINNFVSILNHYIGNWEEKPTSDWKTNLFNTFLIPIT